MKLLFVCLYILFSIVTVQASWESYKAKHGKKYSNKQDAIRRAQFLKTESLIKKHNQRYREGLETYKMDHNKFSDMTPSDRMKRLGRRPPTSTQKSAELDVSLFQRALPASLDLRTNKCMPPIKNQGSCGSCWAFATVTPIEYQKCLKNGTLVTLSEQQVVDCTYPAARDGCQGGDHHDPWNYLFKNGLQPSSTYAYTSGTTGKDTTCKYSSSKVYAKLANTGTDLPQNETAIQAALVANGPITTAYYVSNSFYSYKSGVYSDKTCKKDYNSLNHEMVIVGYGTLNNVPYWIVRNQWGTNWGQAGYVFIKRGTNECGIAVEAGYPKVV